MEDQDKNIRRAHEIERLSVEAVSDDERAEFLEAEAKTLREDAARKREMIAELQARIDK